MKPDFLRREIVMAELNAASRVFDSVTTHLPDATARELWFAVRSELVSPEGGPDAIKEFLDSEATRVRQLVKQALEKAAGN